MSEELKPCSCPYCGAQWHTRSMQRPEPDVERAAIYKSFTDGLEAAAQICGSLAETTYDDSDAFEAATGCEAAIMSVVKAQRKEQAAIAAMGGGDD